MLNNKSQKQQVASLTKPLWGERQHWTELEILLNTQLQAERVMSNKLEMEYMRLRTQNQGFQENILIQKETNARLRSQIGHQGRMMKKPTKSIKKSPSGLRQGKASPTRLKATQKRCRSVWQPLNDISKAIYRQRRDGLTNWLNLSAAINCSKVLLQACHSHQNRQNDSHGLYNWVWRKPWSYVRFNQIRSNQQP